MSGHLFGTSFNKPLSRFVVPTDQGFWRIGHLNVHGLLFNLKSDPVQCVQEQPGFQAFWMAKSRIRFGHTYTSSPEQIAEAPLRWKGHWHLRIVKLGSKVLWDPSFSQVLKTECQWRVQDILDLQSRELIQRWSRYINSQRGTRGLSLRNLSAHWSDKPQTRFFWCPGISTQDSLTGITEKWKLGRIRELENTLINMTGIPGFMPEEALPVLWDI